MAETAASREILRLQPTEDEMSEISIDPRWRQKSTLTSVRLPGGASSGGILTDPEAGRRVILFADEDVDRGAEVVVADGRVLTVTGVRHGTFAGHRVTALEVRRPGPGR